MSWGHHAGAVVLVAAMLLPPAARGQTQPVTPEPPGFADFTQRVQEYAKMQKSMQGWLLSRSRFRTTKKGKEIIERRDALARKIREARSNAKRGDIFTLEISEQFRRVIRSVFQGPSAPVVRKTIRQGEPVKGIRLKVNASYPANLPLTTVPPALLLQLPALPDDIAYAIIDHDFALLDTKARLVIDFIAGAIP